MRSTVTSVVIALLVAGVVLAQADRIEPRGEYLYLQGADEPRNDGCGPGRTCEGWNADHGCLGEGGNGYDGIVTWRPRPGMERRPVTLWYHPAGGPTREHRWTSGTGPREFSGCGLRAESSSPPPIRPPRPPRTRNACIFVESVGAYCYFRCTGGTCEVVGRVRSLSAARAMGWQMVSETCPD